MLVVFFFDRYNGDLNIEHVGAEINDRLCKVFIRVGVFGSVDIVEVIGSSPTNPTSEKSL